MDALDAAAVEAVVEKGIRRPIRLLLGERCYPAALVLIYSGMDTMAFLNMPPERTDVMRSDFIAWADEYMRISLPDPPRGCDLYGTRCSILHGGAPSRFTREGRGRLLRHPEMPCNGSDLSVPDLADAFFAAIDRFFARLAADPLKAAAANRRLEELRAAGPYDTGLRL